MKDKSDPVAMEDSEYPDWLWRILDDQKGAGTESGGSDAGMLYLRNR